MAEQLDLAAILQSLSQSSKPDIWQALGTLGQGLSAAGRTTVGRPAQETIGGALGGFAGSLAQTRQQDQANKLRQLQMLSAVQQITTADRSEKNAVRMDELTEAARVQIPLMLADPQVKAQLPAPKLQAFEIFAKAKPLEAMKQLLSMKGINSKSLDFKKIVGPDGKPYWQGLDKETGVPTGPQSPAAETGTKPSRFIKTIMVDGKPHHVMHNEAGEVVKDLGEAPESNGVNVTTNVEMNKGEESATDLAMAKGIGERLNNEIGTMISAGDKGEFQMGRMQTIVQGMKNYEEQGGDFGALSPVKLTASRYLSALGIKPETFGLVPGDAQPAGEFLQSQFAKGTVATIGSAKGGVPANTFSEKDRQLSERMVSQLDNSKAGIEAKIFVETKASAVAQQRRDRFNDLKERFETGEPVIDDKFNRFPKTPRKPMSAAKAARMALQQVNREFRGRDLYTPEEREKLSAILGTHKRVTTITDIEQLQKLSDEDFKKQMLQR